MRSSKQRSRSKQNRNRSVGNVVNRVFDSSGPEGKVRGTPQQIIDKYNQLARDSQLSGDRVATENFQQHSEHYTRMLAEATREQEARREAQEAQQRDRQQQNQQHHQQQRDDRNTERSDRGAGDQPQPAPQRDSARHPDAGSQPQPETESRPLDLAGAPVSDVLDVEPAADTGLVETPESKPKPKRQPRRKPKPKPEGDAPQQDGGGDQPEAAE